MTATRELVEAFYARIWNQHSTDAVPELLAPDFAFRGSLGRELRGHAGFIEYVDDVHAALAEYHCEIIDLLVDGPRAFARMLFSGVHRGELLGCAATGRRVQWQGAALFTTTNGQISAVWVLGDIHGLLQQLATVAT